MKSPKREVKIEKRMGEKKKGGPSRRQPGSTTMMRDE